ncbi:aldehyde dehydrogenase 3, member A2 [Cichlidogyrus casuarinus]|uniref:Aldehyde dehydrogenase 3, member A2 n=1 Tax=Cichlidogyrus casuarinus TaxID=1844966 RepID=A0ABD2QLW1_9PLAT
MDGINSIKIEEDTIKLLIKENAVLTEAYSQYKYFNQINSLTKTMRASVDCQVPLEPISDYINRDLISQLKEGEKLRHALQNDFTSMLSCADYLKFTELRKKASFVFNRTQIFDIWLDFVLSLPSTSRDQQQKITFDNGSKSILAHLLTAQVLRANFKGGVLRTIGERKKYLKQMYDMMEHHEEEFIEALRKDLNKPKYEAYLCELSQLKAEISHINNNMDSWLMDEKVPRSFLFLMDNSYIQRQPFGLCLILGAWNYPVNLSLLALVGAIAAGNVVLLKPSELAPATESLLAELIPRYLDDVCKVFKGGPTETNQLLQDTRFDMIFYTGGTRVGKLIMAEAAKHLTPVVLELGGKCPTYVDKGVDIDMAASRISWGKFINCGQTCLAPDYILCHEAVYEEFLKAVAIKVEDFYGRNALKSPDYARIVNKNHVQRIQKLIQQTNGKIVCGGDVNEEQKFVAPTVVRDVKPDDVLMQDELFAPIMPVLKVSGPADAIDLVNEKEKPLAVYVFTMNKTVNDLWLTETSSGGFMQNDCIIHISNCHLPFGGVGNSGMGSYHGKYSIECFSHKRAVVNKSTVRSVDFLRMPPYNANSESWGRWFTKSKMSNGSYCCIM